MPVSDPSRADPCSHGVCAGCLGLLADGWVGRCAEYSGMDSPAALAPLPQPCFCLSVSCVASGACARRPPSLRSAVSPRAALALLRSVGSEPPTERTCGVSQRSEPVRIEPAELSQLNGAGQRSGPVERPCGASQHGVAQCRASQWSGPAE